MDTYAINDMLEFSKAMIEVLGREHNMDGCSKYITAEQFSKIVENHAIQEDEKYIVNEEQVCEMMKEAWEMVVGQILAKMASDDILDCAWDDESQDMIFWAKKNDDEDFIRRSEGYGKKIIIKPDPKESGSKITKDPSELPKKGD